MDVYFWTTMLFSSIVFTDCQPKVDLPAQYCAPRPVITTIDESSYRYSPFHVALYRCGGSCLSSPPDVQSCKADQTQVIQVKVNTLSTKESKYIPMVNHTSCKCACVQQELDSCGPNSKWDVGSCKCQCLLDDAACPEGSVFNKHKCKCICARDAIPCLLDNGVVDEKKDWNTTDCGCVCKSKYFKRCSRKEKILDENTCKCVDPPEAQGRGGLQGQTSMEKGLIVATLVMGILCIAVFIYDSYMYHKKIGVLFLCFGKRERGLYSVSAAGERNKATFSNGSKADTQPSNGHHTSDTGKYI